MKRVVFGAIGAFAIGVVGFLSIGIAPTQAMDNPVIKERIDYMRKDVLGNFKVIKAFVKEGKGTMADVAKAAKAIEVGAARSGPLWPKGTGRPDIDEKKTRSLAKIWDDWATFEKAGKAMGAHAGHVAMYAAQNNAEEVAKHFGLMGKEGCGGCHKPFRGPKAK